MWEGDGVKILIFDYNISNLVLERKYSLIYTRHGKLHETATATFLGSFFLISSWISHMDLSLQEID